ncbi:hypothetical protein HYC85_024733 [Camellia sinensis]|uniref:Uncharacterized protein n=1 Tax=Camellia sinensis TaxID=4442 RepID=A0A7J7G9K2_CAMSI|nr:hypothetical protein HYC85_024733 [Camellia sinensis]
MACPILIWWEVLSGFIRHGIGIWGVPQGVPKFCREGGYGQNGLDPLDPKITTPRRPSVCPILTICNMVFREGDEGVRWYVMGDDDSIFFVDNWIDVLGKYNHIDYVYIGGHSEFIMSNFRSSFDQGFGGAGFALSYPLVAAMVKDLEGCLRRYPYLKSAYLITQYCVDELGVPLSAERGIHQELRTLRRFLSSHPQSSVLSLHHFDKSRMLQQTICYQKQTNWSSSISWGYAAHICEKVLPRSVLKRPLKTFLPWVYLKNRPYYMFNTRWLPFVDPCEAPHIDPRHRYGHCLHMYYEEWCRTDAENHSWSDSDPPECELQLALVGYCFPTVFSIFA